jgi:hypothetical protein
MGTNFEIEYKNKNKLINYQVKFNFKNLIIYLFLIFLIIWLFCAYENFLIYFF